MINLIFIALIALAVFLLYLAIKANKKHQNFIELETAALKQLQINNLEPKNYGLLFYRNNVLRNSKNTTGLSGNSSSAA